MTKHDWVELGLKEEWLIIVSNYSDNPCNSWWTLNATATPIMKECPTCHCDGGHCNGCIDSKILLPQLLHVKYD